MKDILSKIIAVFILISLACLPYFLTNEGIVIVLYYVIIIRTLGNVNNFHK